jgi:predicted RNA-binding protein (virulence factor B family)
MKVPVQQTKNPQAWIGEYAFLKVADVKDIGAFLEWGAPKDLFLPRSEQTRPVKPDQGVIVFVYLDNEGRMTASMRLDHHVANSPADYKEGQEVSLMIAAETDLGYKAIINRKHWGVLYHGEVFQSLQYGQTIKGFIKKIREDGKIDLILQQAGHKAAQNDIGPLILEKLKEEGGFLAINDKTSAETIYDLFGVSKKKYKMALGGLYKKRLITIDDDGIRLMK